MLKTGQFTVQSTLDGVRDLKSKYTYDDSLSDLPVVVMMHGFNLSIDAITQEIMNRIAGQGFFVLAVGMRGRQQAGGSPDASGREVHDIYDAIQYVQRTFPVSDRIGISGYSGGGGNALGAVVKFPDLFTVAINHFGMGDYGYADTGWFYTNPSYQSDITQFIGGSPSSMPNAYYSRAHQYGLSNFKGTLLTYHDEQDTNVSIEQSRTLESLITPLPLDSTFYYSDESDTVRYLHSMSVSEKTEPTWLPLIENSLPVKQEDIGELQVHGYVVTTSFSVKLGNLTDHVAEVSYNTQTKTYTVKPKTGRMYVTIRQGNDVFNGFIDADTTIVLTAGESLINGFIKKAYVTIDGVNHRVKKTYVSNNNTLTPVKLRGDLL